MANLGKSLAGIFTRIYSREESVLGRGHRATYFARAEGCYRGEHRGSVTRVTKSFLGRVLPAAKAYPESHSAVHHSATTRWPPSSCPQLEKVALSLGGRINH